MIATLSEIKILLGISDTSKDTLIQANMPIVENFICSFCKNDFIEYNTLAPGSPRIYIQSDKLKFVNSTNSLDRTDTSIDLTDYKLAVGNNLRVYDSYNNNNVFNISSISASSIVFNSVNTVIDEDNSEYITLARAVYPEELKRIFSVMINYNLNKNNLSGLESETILGYSYKKGPTNNSGYPDSMINDLYNYRKILKRPLFNNNYQGGLNYYGN